MECSPLDCVLKGWMGIMKARSITSKNTSQISVKQKIAISVNLSSAWTLKQMSAHNSATITNICLIYNLIQHLGGSHPWRGDCTWRLLGDHSILLCFGLSTDNRQIYRQIGPSGHSGKVEQSRQLGQSRLSRI